MAPLRATENTTLSETIACDAIGVMLDLSSQYKQYHGYVALVVCPFGVLANILSIIVLRRKRNTPATAINSILICLSIVHLLVMLEYTVFAIYVYIIEDARKLHSYGGTLFVSVHMHLTLLLRTVSIAMTVTLAVWRYIVIRFSQQHPIWCTPARCRLALYCCIFVSILAWVPNYFILCVEEHKISRNGSSEILYSVAMHYSEMGPLYQFNFLVSVIVVRFLPCVILIVINCWLRTTLYRTQKREQALRGYNRRPVTRRPSDSQRRADRKTQLLIAVLLLFLITNIPQGLLILLSATRCDRFSHNYYDNFGEIMDLLALLSFAINFILCYTIDEEFRATLNRLLKPNIMDTWQPSRQQAELPRVYGRRRLEVAEAIHL